MRRGELYRVRRLRDDPGQARVYVVVSRQALCDSAHSTVVCVPVHSQVLDIETEVPVGADEGLRYDSVIRCDDMTKIDKTRLTDYVGSLSSAKLRRLDQALRVALDLD